MYEAYPAHDPCAGAVAADRLLARPDRPDAVYGLFDPNGTDLLAAARRYGLRVPDDLLLVCCSESTVYATTEPPITTLSLKPRRIGTAVVQLLIDAIEGLESDRPVEQVIPTELIVRTSSQRRPPRTTVSPPRSPEETSVTTAGRRARARPRRREVEALPNRGESRGELELLLRFTTPGSSHGAIRIPMMGPRHRGPLRPGSPTRCRCGAMVEGSMTQGAGQGPEVERTATLRDFRVPAYVHETGPYAHSTQPGGDVAAGAGRASRRGHPEGYTPTAARPARSSTAVTPLQVARRPRVAERRSRSRRRPGPAVRRRRRARLSRRTAWPRSRSRASSTPTGNWCAGTARLWFLGDFTDRGPDGIGVIDLVMRLSAEAAAAGGYCKALMGNHELLLLGAKRFGDTPVNSGAGTATFQAAWLLNGGQKTDMDRLQDHHLQWMARLDAIEEVDGHLLVHSDTTAYLDYGDSIEAVNDTVRETLTRNDADECWDLFRKFTKRFAFRDEGGADAVRALLDTYGGTRIVHGHSPIPYLLGEVGSEDGEDSARPVVEGPHVYADGLAIAMDGGVTMAGKLLVQQLPLDI